MKKVLSLVVVMVMLLTMVIGCANNDAVEQGSQTATGSSDSAVQASDNDKPFTIRVNSNQKSDAELKQFDAAINRFKQKYPNATVEIDTGVDTGDFSEYAQRLLTQIAGGDNPDIIWMAVEGIRFLADNDVIVPIDDYVENSAALKEQINDVDQMILKCFEYNGKLYAAPLGWNNNMIIYNTKLFEQEGIKLNPDWTWDEFVEIAKKLTDNSAANQRWGFAMGPYLSNYQMFMVNNGTYTMNETWDEPTFSSPKSVETMEFIYDLINKHKVMPLPENNVNYSDMFMAGRIAMINGGAWYLKTFKEKGFSDFDYMSVPTNGTKGTSYGADGYALVNGSKNPQAAADLIAELTGPEIQMLIAENGTSVPASKKAAYSDTFLSMSPNVHLMYDSLQLDNVRVIPSPTYYPDMNDSFTRHWAAATSGQKSVEQAMIDTDNDIKAMNAKASK